MADKYMKNCQSEPNTYWLMPMNYIVTHVVICYGVMVHSVTVLGRVRFTTNDSFKRFVDILCL